MDDGGDRQPEEHVGTGRRRHSSNYCFPVSNTDTPSAASVDDDSSRSGDQAKKVI